VTEKMVHNPASILPFHPCEKARRVLCLAHRTIPGWPFTPILRRSMRLKLTLYLPILAFIILVGLVLRIVSYTWNTRLYGDVNLFALAAREYALHGELQYPMKYEFSDNVPYLALTTPASQHPPLWSWLGGSLARLFGTSDTFSLLKPLSLLCGLGLLLSSFALSRRVEIYHEARIALGLACLSPVLVDFSANGSMYILSAWVIVLSSLLLMHFDPARWSHGLLAGLLCGLGYLVHSSLLLLPVAFLLPLIAGYHFTWVPKTSSTGNPSLRQRLPAIGSFLLAFLASLSPWLLWNFRNFQRPFYSISSYYLLDKLGLLKTGIYGDVISARLSGPLSASILSTYAILAAKAWWATSRQVFMVLGPFILLIMLFGLVQLYRTRKDGKLYALAAPAFLYALAIALWATNKFRFLVPLLAPAYLLAAIGFASLLVRSKWYRWLGYLCLVGGLVWMLASYLGTPQPTFYYGNETAQDARIYDQMRPLAGELARQEPGVTLGVAQALDGGIETVYWTGFPFVAGRGMGLDEWHKLAVDFNVRYVWADEATLELAHAAFPEARQIRKNPPFYVFEIVH
jgi:hypothetical protein